MALSPSDVLALYRFPLLNRGASAGGGNTTINNSYYETSAEGNYSSWTLLTDIDLGSARLAGININAIWIDEKNGRIIFNDSSSAEILSTVKVDGSELSDLLTGTGLAPGAQEYYSQEQGSHTSSVHGKYGVIMNATLTALYVLVGGAIQSLSASAFYNSDYNRTSCFAISSSGKYIVVIGPKAAADHQCHLMVWKGVGTDVIEGGIEGNYSTWTAIPFDPIVCDTNPPAILFTGDKLFYNPEFSNPSLPNWLFYDIATGVASSSPVNPIASSVRLNGSRSVLGKYILMVPVDADGSRIVYADGVATSMIFTAPEGFDIWSSYISDNGKYVAIVTHPSGDFPYSITIYQGSYEF